MCISNKFPDAAADPQPTLREPLLPRTSTFCSCYNGELWHKKKDTYGLLNVDISGGLLGLWIYRNGILSLAYVERLKSVQVCQWFSIEKQTESQ